MTNQDHPKLFLFCIGGTGSRVLKSLTFLLASGVNIKASKVIPIIIDPDETNGDVQRTIDVLKMYQSIRKSLEFQHNGFFKTEIQTLANSEKADANAGSLPVPDEFRFEIGGTQGGHFNQFIGYNDMTVENKAMTDMLFSKKNLNMELTVGFKGNPHMGSVVLNQFKNSQAFKAFASRLGSRDRVFIISSIFGGTGAAGFPLLVKNIREADEKLSNHDRLKNVPIGAITVTPYFGVEQKEEMTIDKNSFIAKTKAALEYYADNLTGNNSLNALYYIGDMTTRDYKAAEGKNDQQNWAHVIEVFSAIAIIDYMALPPEKVKCDKGKALFPVYKEYAIQGDEDRLTFKNLGAYSRSIVARPLTQYAMAWNFWQNSLKDALNKPEGWARSNKTPITGTFLTSDFYRAYLAPFNRRFQEWLKELSDNTRSFAPFNLDTHLLHTLVNGYTPMKKVFLGMGGEKPEEWDYTHYNYALAREEEKLPALPPEQRFISLFYNGTKQLVEDRFKTLR